MLTQAAQDGPRAGTTSRPDDISFRPPVWMDAGPCATPSLTASVTCPAALPNLHLCRCNRLLSDAWQTLHALHLSTAHAQASDKRMTSSLSGGMHHASVQTCMEEGMWQARSREGWMYSAVPDW